MKTDVPQRVVALKNELRAYKVASGITYSQLLMPDNTPTESYSGTASLSGSGSTPVARLRFRFTREDGFLEAPMINFAYSANISPTYRSFAESNGFTFSADDLSYLDRLQIAGYIAELGEGYVDYYLDFSSNLRDMFFSLNSLSISATCEAIANIKGSLSVERLI